MRRWEAQGRQVPCATGVHVMVEQSQASGHEEPPGKRWNLRILGGFWLTGPDGVEATGLGKPDRALLAYLVLSRQQRHPRAKLATLLWPNRIEALHSLSVSLNALRKALGDKEGSIIVPKSDPLICYFDAVDADAVVFESLVSRGTPDALEQAEALYGADLLDGMDIKSDEFNHWLLSERERLRGLAVDCLCRLMRLREMAGLPQRALETARRILAFDELCEDAHRAIMRLHLQAGQRAAARRHAQSCEDLFRREKMEVEPETQRLLIEVRKAPVSEPTNTAATMPATAEGVSEPPSIGVSARATTVSESIASDSHSSIMRRLTAILAADVVGYSRLMEQDEAGTFSRLRTHRKELFEPEIAKHRGQIFKLMGDGMLAEFGSVVDAVECAVMLQRGMAERNAGLAEHQRINVRIGVNLGDVIVEGDDRYGDGVNIAARLQELATPGSVCVSRTVYNHVRQKLALAFEHVGDHQVKNITEPVSVYRVRFDGESTRQAAKMPPPPARRWQWVAAAVVAIAAGVALWSFFAPESEPALPLPDKPSIAVLPFDSLSDDPKWSRLADGLTEDVTTSLSRSRDLFVIARNSTAIYKGKAVDVRNVGTELGVKYVLEGSVQAFENRVRVTAQLIDAAGRSHVWSEQYDRPPTDIFSIQDDVTANIAGRLLGFEGALNEAEREKLRRKPPANLKAFDYYLLAMQAKHRVAREDIDKAKELFGRALDLDPGLARAYVGLAWLCELEISLGYTPSVAQSRECKLTSAQKAIALDPYDGEAHAALATYYADSGDFRGATMEFERAEALAPNNADVLLFHGAYLSQLGKPELAVEKVERAVRLNPNFPPWYNRGLRLAYYFAGQFDDALAAAQRVEPSAANDYAWLAVAFAQLGRSQDASEAAGRTIEYDPEWSAERRMSDFGAFARDTEPLLFAEGARKAGLPVCATAAQLQQWPDMKRLAACEQQRMQN